MLFITGSDDGSEGTWTTNNMNIHRDNSNYQNKIWKNALDLNSNPGLENSDWYVGKVISQKSIMLNTIHNVLKLAWARYITINILEATTGVLTFDFENETDQCKILDLSPWAINGHVQSIKIWDPSIGIKDVDFNKVNFWVQIHDLGLEKFSTENVSKIGNKIENCMEVEQDIETTRRSCMRMKVDIDVGKPLMVRFWWTNSKGVDRWASIKYG